MGLEMQTCLTINAENLRKIYIDGPSLAVLMRDTALVRVPLRRLGKIIIHGSIGHVPDANYCLYSCRTDRNIAVLLCNEAGQLQSEILPCKRDFMTRELFINPLKYNPLFFDHYQKWRQKIITDIHLNLKNLFNARYQGPTPKVTIKTKDSSMFSLLKHFGIGKSVISSPENPEHNHAQEKSFGALYQYWNLEHFDQMLLIYLMAIFKKQEVTDFCQGILNELLIDHLKSRLHEMGSGVTGRGSRTQLFNDFFPELQRLASYLMVLWFDQHKKAPSRQTTETCYYIYIFKEVNRHILYLSHSFDLMMREFYFIDDTDEIINL